MLVCDVETSIAPTRKESESFVINIYSVRSRFLSIIKLRHKSYLLSSAIAGLNAGGNGGSRRSSAAALPRAVVAQDFSLVPFLPHRRRVRLADRTEWFQTQRHR